MTLYCTQRQGRLAAALMVLLGIMLGPGPTSAFEACKFTERVPKTRPVPKSGVTQVRFTVYIIDLVSIDNQRQEFTVDAYVEAEWKDPRLKFQKAAIKTCEAPLDTIWNPSLYLLNARSITTQFRDVVRIDTDGTVTYGQRGIGTYSAKLDLTKFPFDTQLLSISIISSEYGPQEVRFNFKAGGRAARFSEPGWAIKYRGTRVSAWKVAYIRGMAQGQTLSRFDFVLTAKRDVAFYFWKIMVPIFLIVGMSWAVFWLDPNDVGVQMGIGTASMITIVVFLFTSNNELPKISYLTRLDLFVYASLLLVFSAFVQALTTCAFAERDRLALARRIDVWSRAMFPAVYVVAVGLFWLL